MNKSFLWGKLQLKLILCIIIAFLLSIGIFVLLLSTGEEIFDNYLNKTSWVQEQHQQAIDDFRKFVSDENLSIEDHEQIAAWVQEAKYVNVYIYVKNKLIYATDGYTSTTGTAEQLLSTIFKDKPVIQVEFSDATAQIYLDSFFEYKHYYIVIVLAIFISFLFFVILILIFISRKTSYIGTLEREIKILEGGDLKYPITLYGKDELSSLAHSINEMRKSFIEKLESEERARLANSELITAMSHDLRTPLTALVGYLDIIEYKKYKTEEDLHKYICSSREKAYQIKQLSDKLFEYFTVFNANTEDDLELDLFDGIQLMEQLMEEQLFILQTNGFQHHIETCHTPFQIELNLISIRRVFDNIFSNIIKYADKSQPIKIHYYVKHQLLFIDIENYIFTDVNNVESTGIGMKTCERIIKIHKGKMAVTRTDELYSVHISLKILP